MGRGGRLEHLTQVALVVVDGLVGADNAAGAAVDAELRVNDVEQHALTGDRIGGTTADARGAASAVFGDDEGHRCQAVRC